MMREMRLRPLGVPQRLRAKRWAAGLMIVLGLAAGGTFLVSTDTAAAERTKKSKCDPLLESDTENEASAKVWQDVVGHLDASGKSGVTFDAKAVEVIRDHLLKAVVDFAEANLITPPPLGELAKAIGVDEALMSQLIGPGRAFETMDALRHAAKESKPKLFSIVKDTTRYTKERQEALVAALRDSPRYIMTTWVTGQSLDQDTFKSFLTLSKNINAPIIIGASFGEIDAIPDYVFELPNVHVITTRIDANENWIVNPVPLMPKQGDPTMGLDSFGGPTQSLLLFHPQAWVKTVPTGTNQAFSKKVISTGAITEAEYMSPTKVGQRTDILAEENHFKGAVILEKTPGPKGMEAVGGAGQFNFRHVEYIAPSTDGSRPGGIMDLGHFFTADGRVKKVPIEGLVLGDLHVGVTDPKALLAAAEQLLGPGGLDVGRGSPEIKRIFVHDLADGTPINPHEGDNTVVRRIREKQGDVDFREHLERAVEALNGIHALQPKSEIVVVYDNHGGQWASRWLSAGGFLEDATNSEYGAQLFVASVQGKSPFAEALKRIGVDRPNQVTFLEKGQSYRVGMEISAGDVRGVEAGNHLHAGANGAKGLSPKAQKKAYGRSIGGHYHADFRINGTVRIAALTPTRQPYSMEGPSSASQSVGIVGPHNEIQVLPLVQEWFFVPEAQAMQPADQFFAPGYPKIVERKVPQGEGTGATTDQWSSFKGVAKTKKKGRNP